jgi:glycosyltransferase involved in cell wall biosynthesis
MTEPTRVLHVLSPAPIGGAESVVLELTAAMQTPSLQAGIAVIGVDIAAHPFVAAARQRALPVEGTSMHRYRYVAQARAVAGMVRRGGVHVIHTHGFKADVIGGMAGWLTRRPTVSTLHGFTGSGVKTGLLDRLARRAHQRASALIAVSAPIREELIRRGMPAERVHVIPNAVQAPHAPLTRAAARHELGVNAATPRIGWIGRLSSEKGADVFLHALAEIPTGVAWQASIIGDGPEAPALRTLCHALGLEARVEWHGVRAAAATLLPAFDVLVLSSHTEGTPMVLLEAMHAGTPIVATRVGGVPDMLGAGQALLVPPAIPSALAEAIAATLADPDAARARAALARREARATFGMDAWVTRHDALYRSLRR